MDRRRTRSQSPVPADNLYEDVETEPFDYAGRELDTLNVAHLGRILRSNIRCTFDKGTPDSVIELSTKLPAETRHNKKCYVAYVRREIERIRAIPDISTRMRLRKCEEDWRLAFGTSRSFEDDIPPTSRPPSSAYVSGPSSHFRDGKKAKMHQFISRSRELVRKAPPIFLCREPT